MPIVSSEIVSDRSQASGRRKIVERHTDDTGGIHTVFYRAAAGFDADARLALNAIRIAAYLEDEEAANFTSSVISGEQDGVVPNPPLRLISNIDAWTHCMNTVRQRDVETEPRLNALVLAEHVAANFTNTQLRNAFGVSQSYIVNWRAKVANLRTLKPLVDTDQTEVPE